MSPTSEFMAGSPLALSYPELFRVTGPLPSLVLRAEDMWQRYNQCLEVGGALNQGFPFSPLMSHFRGLLWTLELRVSFHRYSSSWRKLQFAASANFKMADVSEPNWTKKSNCPTITLGATLSGRRPAFLR